MASLKEMRAELQTIAANTEPIRGTLNSGWRPTIKLSKTLAEGEGDFDSYRLTYNVLDRAQRKAIREWLAKHDLAVSHHDITGSRWNWFHVLDLWPTAHVPNKTRHEHLLRYGGED